MKNKVEIKYVSNADKADNFSQFHDHWELTVQSDIMGRQVLSLTTEQAMVIGLALGVARETGRKEGYEKAKKKYKAINKIANMNIPVQKPLKPWEDAAIPMHWNPDWKLNDPRK